MKGCFEKESSCEDITNCASISGQSKDDQETGSSDVIPKREVVPLKNLIFPCFPNEMDLNPARVVRKSAILFLSDTIINRSFKHIFNHII